MLLLLLKFQNQTDKVFLIGYFTVFSLSLQIDGLTGKSFKFDEVDKLTRKVASGLAKLGVKKGRESSAVE